MFRAIGKSFFLAVLILAGSAGLYLYHYHSSVEYQNEILQKRNEELEHIVGRLQTERRVAKILVTDQKRIDGKLQTSLLFVEYRKDGSALPAKPFCIDGNEVHIDAEVVKFKDEYVETGDALRGQSIMLFVRLYGADQAPSSGFPIDQPGEIPEIYRGVDPAVSNFEQDLWNNFWKLYNDKSARESRGIRGLDGEGLWGQFDMDHVYTITVRADGGGSIEEEPVDPIYRDAMHQK